VPSRLRVRFRILVSWTAVAGHRFGFPHRRDPPHPKLRQAGALQDTLMATKRLGQLRSLDYPQPFASSHLRVSPFPLLPDDRPHLQISAFPESLATRHPPPATHASLIPQIAHPSLSGSDEATSMQSAVSFFLHTP
jgi:hypothetical protein